MLRIGRHWGKLILHQRPGTVIEIRSVGPASVLCFRSGSEELFLALDHHLPSRSIDDALDRIANMLACCQHCANRGLRSLLCRGEYRLMARRLNGFLGATGYHEFLAQSPIFGLFENSWERLPPQ